MQHYRPRRSWQPPAYTRPVPVDPCGLAGPTKGQARGPRWRRTGPNLYVPAHVDPTVPEQRIVEAAGHVPPDGALTGWAVLRLRGGWMFDGLEPDGRTPLPVPVVAGPHNGRRPRAGISYHYDRVELVSSVSGMPCVPVTRALFDAMRTGRGLFPAVVAADMAMFCGLVTPDRMDRFVETRAGWAGVPLVRRALALADPHAASPQETRLRLLWELGLRLPRPLVNVALFSRDGELLGYPDLLDVEAGLVVEYDGADHRSARRHSDDVDREARLRAVGLEVTRVTGGDLSRPRQLARRLLEARRRARFNPPSRRSWSLEPALEPSLPAHYCPEGSWDGPGELTGQ